MPSIYKLKHSSIRFYNKYFFQSQKAKEQMFSNLTFSHHSAFRKYIPEDQLQQNKLQRPVIILQPIKKQLQLITLDQSLVSSFEESIREHIIFKEEQQSDVSEQLILKNDLIPFSQTMEDLQLLELKKRRKNKLETKNQISKKQRDEGRGGNCIASNITKTLFRIVQMKLNNKAFHELKTLTELYKIKSQKQNTIILLLILYVFVMQGKLELSIFQEIITVHFLKSLQESKNNCEKKMEQETERRNFHLKNKRMYSRFIEINTQLYENLKHALTSNKTTKLQLVQIEAIIADTYDRKQRQIEKAMNKIKSVILNHSELKQLFDLNETDVEEAFFESIEYAYRRNLPKRCKQTRSKAQQFFDQFQKAHNIKSDQDKYFMCYLALKLIGEKEKEIWDEFIINLRMKSQFNNSESELNHLTIQLKNIPEQIDQLERKKQLNSFNLCSKELKMEIQSTFNQKVVGFYNTYLGHKNNHIF